MLKPENLSMEFRCRKLKQKVSDGMSEEAKLAMDLARQDTPWKLCPIDEIETGSSGYSSESPDPCSGNSRMTPTSVTGINRVTHTNITGINRQRLEPGIEHNGSSKTFFANNRQQCVENGTINNRQTTEDGIGISRTMTNITENGRSKNHEKTTGNLRFLDVYEKESVPRLTGDITKKESSTETSKLRSLCGEKLACAMESVETVIYGENQNDDDDDDTATEESAIRKSLGKCRVWMIMNDQKKHPS